MLIWIAAVILVPFAIGRISINLFRVRAALPALAATLIVIAIGVVGLRSRPLRIGVLAGLLLLPTPTLIQHYTSRSKDDWRGAARYVGNRAGPGAVVVISRGDYTPFEYYWRRPNVAIYKREAADLVKYGLPPAVQPVDGFWLFLSHVPSGELHEILRATRAKEPANERPRRVEVRSFNGVLVVGLLK
jgi:hypothetical protein